MILVAGATTASGAACSFEVDEFKKGDAAKVDSTTLVDSNQPDTVVTDTTVPPDTKIDSSMGDSVTITETDAADADVVVDTRPDVDTGPPIPEVGCTAVGPPGTVCIPTTTFSLGAASVGACGGTGCGTELPKVSVKVNQFFIDQHEVTVKRFRTWWNTTPRPWPAAGTTIFTSGAKDLKWRNTWPTAPTEPPSSGCTWAGATNAVNDDKPINCVDWYTALAFCIWDGKRLPSEAEWELVASGGDDRLFPWSFPGSEDDAFVATDVTCSHALNGTCSPLTESPNSTVWGRSRFGVWNLAGSLAEWTVDVYAGSYSGVTAGTLDPIFDPTTTTSNARITRGGSFMSGAVLMRAAARPISSTSATSQDSQIGFRCAKRS